jgi:hypothetical protein
MVRGKQELKTPDRNSSESHFSFRVVQFSTRVARFFLVQHTKVGKNIPNYHKMYTCP